MTEEKKPEAELNPVPGSFKVTKERGIDLRSTDLYIEFKFNLPDQCLRSGAETRLEEFIAACRYDMEEKIAQWRKESA